MESPIHTLSTLFSQLGLDSSEEAMASFIEKHSGIADDTLLHEAHFWRPTQAEFLKNAIEQDADWAEVVDTFDAMLRKQGP